MDHRRKRREDSATVTDGSPSIFASVNTGNPEYVVFTMTDGSIYKVAKTGDSN